MARFALTSPRDIDFVGSLRPHGRNGAYRIRDEPKGLTGGQGSIPIWIRLRWMRNRLSGHCNYRAASHGSTPCARDDVAMTSSDVAPRSQHPATLRVRFACSIVSTRMLRVNDRHATLLFPIGGLQGGLGPPCSVDRSRLRNVEKRTPMAFPDGGQGNPKNRVFGGSRGGPGGPPRGAPPGAPPRARGGPGGPPRGTPSGGPLGQTSVGVYSGSFGGLTGGSNRTPRIPPK